MLCFKFHQNRAINQEFDFIDRGPLCPPRGALSGAEGPDFKNSKNSLTERWSQPTPKISAFQLI